jgi:xanthine dehydrogenase accessory factor
MKELSDIVIAYENQTKVGLPCALATVVGVSGSTYRRPGARMLFSGKGRVAGLINAACLESDLSERAKAVIQKGEPELVSYDTTSPDDIVFGLGLGCNGTVEILMESSQTSALPKKIEVLKQTLSSTGKTILATVVDPNNVRGIQRGDFIARDAQGKPSGTIAIGPLVSLIEAEIPKLSDLPFAQKIFPIESGKVRVVFEILAPPLPLLVFGAGPDVLPLVDAARLLGWRITVVDHRPAYATKENVPGADSVLLSEPDRVSELLSIRKDSVAVIMTHNFDKDLKLLKLLLNSPAQYVGLLGPKSKLEMLLTNLRQEGFVPTEAQLKRLHAPIGLDIGAETPEEIAVSIIAEIKSVLTERSGGFLKDRQGAIH